MAQYGVNEMWWYRAASAAAPFGVDEMRRLAGGHAQRTVGHFSLQERAQPASGSVSEHAVFACEFAGGGGDKRRSVCRKMSVSVCMSSASPHFRKVKLYKKTGFFSTDFCLFLLYYGKKSVKYGQKEEKCTRIKNSCPKNKYKKQLFWLTIM